MGYPAPDRARFLDNVKGAEVEQHQGIFGRPSTKWFRRHALVRCIDSLRALEKIDRTPARAQRYLIFTVGDLDCNYDGACTRVPRC